MNIEDDFDILHIRLGHIGAERMTWLARGELLCLLSSVIFPKCEKYLIGKSTRKLFGKDKCALILLDLIHYDISGPFNVKVPNECSYLSLLSMIFRDMVMFMWSPTSWSIGMHSTLLSRGREKTQHICENT